jgi:hypothetical protein
MTFRVFVDSGAYTILTQGIDLSVEDYIEFIFEYEDRIEGYTALDNIKDPEITLANHLKMEWYGLKPIPCFHYGENPEKYLVKYLENHDYVALGGMVPRVHKVMIEWLDDLFTRYLDGSVKVHGFGIGTPFLLGRYPWYSVDSRYWLMNAYMGLLPFPRRKEGELDYLSTPHWIAVSARAQYGRAKNIGIGLGNISPLEREVVEGYIVELGVPLGKSEIVFVDEGYKLGADERWVNKGRGIVEQVVSIGMVNDRFVRMKANIAAILKSAEAKPDMIMYFGGVQNSFSRHQFGEIVELGVKDILYSFAYHSEALVREKVLDG